MITKQDTRVKKPEKISSKWSETTGSLIHSFIKNYSLTTYYEPDIILASGNTDVNKRVKTPSSWSLYSRERKTAALFGSHSGQQIKHIKI